MPEKLMTASEVADYLSIPINTLYQWRHQRKGPAAAKVGRHVRYRQHDVDEWIKRRTEPGDD